MGTKGLHESPPKSTVRSCHTQIPCGTDDIQKDRIVRNRIEYTNCQKSQKGGGRGGEEGRRREGKGRMEAGREQGRQTDQENNHEF